MQRSAALSISSAAAWLVEDSDRSRTMSRDIRARIGSARLLLGPLVSQPTHAPASHTQCVALLDAIQKSSLSIEERASLSGLALGVSWCGDDAKSIADAFVSPPKLQRQSMHNFEALREYLSIPSGSFYWIRRTV